MKKFMNRLQWFKIKWFLEDIFFFIIPMFHKCTQVYTEDQEGKKFSHTIDKISDEELDNLVIERYTIKAFQDIEYFDFLGRIWWVGTSDVRYKEDSDES